MSYLSQHLNKINIFHKNIYANIKYIKNDKNMLIFCICMKKVVGKLRFFIHDVINTTLFDFISSFTFHIEYFVEQMVRYLFISLYVHAKDYSWLKIRQR